MKKSELFFSAILVPIDYLTLVFAGLTAYSLRFTPWATELRPIADEILFRDYLNAVLLIAVLWMVVFTLAGLYNIKSTRKFSEEFAKIFLACSTAIFVIIILYFFRREFFSSRFIILGSWIISIIFVTFARSIIRYIQRRLLKIGKGVHQIVVIGQDETTKNIIEQIYKNPGLGYKIIKRFDDFSERVAQKVKEELKYNAFDEIIQADPNLSRKQSLELIDFCNENHLIFKYSANLFQTKASNIEIGTISGIPVFEIKKTPLDGWGKIIKRLFDVVFSFLGLIILSPLFLVLSIIIKLDSKGRAFVGLERIGEGGMKFVVYKFRSMVKGAHSMKKNLLPYNERNDGPLFKMENDPRITRFGNFIRKWSLDEFPQLWNVLKGEMSLVGPRPHEPEEVKNYKKHHKKLLTIKPGMTGLAQISGRSDLNFEDEVRLDNYYVENWSIWFDLQILIKTPLVVLSRSSAI